MLRRIGLAVAVLALAVPATAGAVEIKEFTIPAGSFPRGITQGPDGNMWVAADGGAILRVNPASGAALAFGVAGASPTGIAAGSDRNLWFTSVDGGVWRITPTGEATQFLPPTSGGTDGITAGPDGALWYTMRGSGGIVGRVSTDGTFTEFPTPTTTSGPTRIASGPDGRLWFTEQIANQIGRVTTTGVFEESAVPTAGAGANAITAGPDGAVWFTELLTSRIGRITTAGATTEFPLPANGQPEGIVAGPDGALWFVDGLTARLGRITVDGQFTMYDLPGGGGPPVGIATGPGNTLWYTRGTERVGRVDLLPPPAVGKTVNVETVTGTVLVRAPKGKRFVRLGADGRQIPTGSQVDTRKGTVSLTAAKGTGQNGTSTSEFFDGVFTVTQPRSVNAVTEAKLSGPLEGCSKRRGATTSARKGRRLWGRGKGRFRTRGRRSGTIIRGTTWFIEDRCDGSTLTRVTQGTVDVQDFGTGRTITLKAPGTYVARPRR